MNKRKKDNVFLCANYQSNHPMLKGQPPRESYTCVGCINRKKKWQTDAFVYDGKINCLNVKVVRQ